MVVIADEVHRSHADFRVIPSKQQGMPLQIQAAGIFKDAGFVIVMCWPTSQEVLHKCEELAARTVPRVAIALE